MPSAGRRLRVREAARPGAGPAGTRSISGRRCEARDGARAPPHHPTTTIPFPCLEKPVQPLHLDRAPVARQVGRVRGGGGGGRHGGASAAQHETPLSFPGLAPPHPPMRSLAPCATRAPASWLTAGPRRARRTPRGASAAATDAHGVWRVEVVWVHWWKRIGGRVAAIEGTEAPPAARPPAAHARPRRSLPLQPPLPSSPPLSPPCSAPPPPPRTRRPPACWRPTAARPGFRARCRRRAWRPPAATRPPCPSSFS
jgi:hypothetical protein